jgi:ClpP class serine protease
MDLLNLLWILLAVAAVIPLIRQRMIEAARMRLIHALEEKRGTRLIVLIHRQESMNFLGFNVARYIDIQDSEDILRAIKLTDPKLPIDLILHTPGGLVLAAEQIAYALCKRQGKVTVFVPHYAMSGGMLIALAADEIVMDENAVLGPVDPQIGEYPAVSILNALEQKDLNELEDRTLILADVARKAVRQVKETVTRLAQSKYDPQQAEKIAEALTLGQWTHDYPITIEQARDLGLKISSEVPPEKYQLMSLYPQAATRRPSVIYIPLPYPQRPALPDRTDRKNLG